MYFTPGLRRCGGDCVTGASTAAAESRIGFFYLRHQLIYGRELISCNLKIIFNSKTKRTIRASFSLFSFFFRRDWEGVAPGDLIDPRRSLPTSSLSSAFLLRSGGRAPPSAAILQCSLRACQCASSLHPGAEFSLGALPSSAPLD